MKFEVRKPHHFSSHLPALLYVLERTSGSVLELGIGLFSTPFLHYYCVTQKRKLTSVDNNHGIYQHFKCFEHEYHDIVYTEDWELSGLVIPYDVVFIDHAPALQRRVDLMRFAHLAQYIVVHDTNGRQNKHYRLSCLWSKFRYIKTFDDFFPMTTVVSNYYELGE